MCFIKFFLVYKFIFFSFQLYFNRFIFSLSQDLIINLITAFKFCRQTAIFRFHYHTILIKFCLKALYFSFYIFILIVLNCLILKWTNKIWLHLFIKIKKYYCWNLKFVNIKVLEPFRVASNIYPWIIDRNLFCFLVNLV